MKRIALLSLVLICCMTTAFCDQRVLTVHTGGSRLPMLWMPLSSSSVVTYIPDGASVAVESEQDGWCLVTYERKSGYVRAHYLRTEPEEIGDAFVDEPDESMEQAMLLTQNRARDIADAALTRVYPDFLLSEYGIVQVSYREDTQQFGTYYGFEYFCADGSSSYRCFIDAYTGSILKLLPPEK